MTLTEVAEDLFRRLNNGERLECDDGREVFAVTVKNAERLIAFVEAPDRQACLRTNLTFSTIKKIEVTEIVHDGSAYMKKLSEELREKTGEISKGGIESKRSIQFNLFGGKLSDGPIHSLIGKVTKWLKAFFD